MKKKILILLTGLVLGLSSAWAKGGGGCVILQHAGNETYFEAQDAQAAMDAAVEGDTLYFAEAETGLYPKITMNKKVYIISSGSLFINLEIPGNPSLDECLFQTYSNRLEINVKSDLQRLYLNDTFLYVYANTENVTVGSLEMDRCLIEGIWYNSGLKKIVANNCLFEDNFNLVGETQGLQSATFTNCRFTISEIPVVNGTFKNSIFNYYSDTPYTINACTFTNCLMDKDYWVLGEGSTKASCYNLNRETFSNDKDYLTSNNYLGSDGTVVGEWGGTNPFKDGRSYGAAANIWNLNKKGNKMSVRMEIYDR